MNTACSHLKKDNQKAAVLFSKYSLLQNKQDCHLLKKDKARFDCDYVSGLIQGDGGVSLSFRDPRKRKKGIKYCFHIGQHLNSLDLLVRLKDFFQCGKIQKVSPTYYRFMVSDLESLLNKILPHFVAYPLKDEKKDQFNIFSEVCKMVKHKEHLTEEGFEKIVRIAYKMNMDGKRRKHTMEEYLKLVVS